MRSRNLVLAIAWPQHLPVRPRAKATCSRCSREGPDNPADTAQTRESLGRFLPHPAVGASHNKAARVVRYALHLSYSNPQSKWPNRCQAPPGRITENQGHRVRPRGASNPLPSTAGAATDR